MLHRACELLKSNDNTGYDILNWLYGAAIPIEYIVEGQSPLFIQATLLNTYLNKFPPEVYLCDESHKCIGISTKDAFKFVKLRYLLNKEW